MDRQRAYLGFINAVARVVGVFWIFGGVVFLVSSFVTVRYRGAYVAVSIFLLVAGVALLLVRPLRQRALSRLMNRHSPP